MSSRNRKENQSVSKAEIIAHAWKDPSFKKKLLSDPRAALKEMGYSFPENMKIQVIEEQANTLTLVLPGTPPESKILSESELTALAAGAKITVAIPGTGC